MKELLNIVNEADEIIGQESRDVIHRDGLLHREVHVYFATPNQEVIFQHRAKDKDTFPDLLDATVGGHVEIGDSYEKTALKETLEETGLQIQVSDLIFINQTRKKSVDKVTGKINAALKNNYLYIYRGAISDLKIEIGKSQGFETWPLEKLLKLREAEKDRFIRGVLNFVVTEVAEFLKTQKL